MSRAQLTSTVEQNTGGAVSPYVAGKNIVINGGMDIWQRGTSFAITAPGQILYSADRWTCYAGNTGTISQDTSLVPSGFQASLKFTSNLTNSGMDFYQLVETQNTIPLQGKTVTFSAYVAGTTGKVPSVNAYYSTTTDDYIYLHSGVLIGTQTTSTGLSSTTFQRVSVTFTVPTSAKTIRLGLSSGVLNNGEFINWTGVQLEVGSVPTQFSRAGGTLSGELAACQRYYWRSTGVEAYGRFAGMAIAQSTPAVLFAPALPVTMRTYPQSLDYSNIYVYDGVTGIAVSSATIQSGGGSLNSTSLNLAVTGAVQYRPYFVATNNNAAGYIGYSAEL